MKKIITESQNTRKVGNLEVMSEMGRIRRGASPEPTFSPSQALRKQSVDQIVHKNRQQSLDLGLQSNLDPSMTIEILTRISFLSDLR